ncbi:Transferase [Sesbania bispinosa]|nr:Transferase [Sesbania bispinosa]
MVKVTPVQRIFFYEFPHPTPLFYDTLLPKLKQSLSLALGYFYLLSGHLIWPLHSHKPIINYTSGDTVSLILAESGADFNHLAGTDLCEATESHQLLSHLTISHEKASVLALQVTLFPNSGFFHWNHHAPCCSRWQNFNFFYQAWAYLCNKLREELPSSLPPELVPFYDREVVKDPSELEARYVNIEKLKQFVVSKQKGKKNLHLSTFVARSEPPLPPTYFGNCIGGTGAVAKTRELLGEDGLIVAVEALSETLERLKDGVLSGAESWTTLVIEGLATGRKISAVAGHIGLRFIAVILVGEDQRKWR